MKARRRTESPLQRKKRLPTYDFARFSSMITHITATQIVGILFAGSESTANVMSASVTISAYTYLLANFLLPAIGMLVRVVQENRHTRQSPGRAHCVRRSERTCPHISRPHELIKSIVLRRRHSRNVADEIRTYGNHSRSMLQPFVSSLCHYRSDIVRILGLRCGCYPARLPYSR